MTQYRYRTDVLVGPWRSSRYVAIADAMRARQAIWDKEQSRVRWLVPAAIEEAPATPIASPGIQPIRRFPSPFRNPAHWAPREA